MSLYRPLRGALFRLDAEVAHRAGIAALALGGGFEGACAQLHRAAQNPGVPPLTVGGVALANPIGLAAGLDKDAEAIPGLFALGFGSVEVGTVTPRPQPGNPTPRLFRLPAHQALINRMGFNNHGAEAMAARLRELTQRPGPIGVNIGKNRDTPLEHAADDYAACARILGSLADYLVINASSPNTPGLRDLQAPRQLATLITAVQKALRDAGASSLRHTGAATPLWLKIAPDLSLEEVDAIVDVARDTGIAALIATNTTSTRPVDDPLTVEAGGFSGPALAPLSNRIISRIREHSKGALPVIGVGGIRNAEDVRAKLDAGASAVQVYTGLIYEGPGLVRRLLKDLRTRQ